ncbi:MAG: hypothetical protein R3F61_11380 [Myxococcota bacterium]
MSFTKVVNAFAAVATLVQVALVTLLGAHFLTLDGNTLRIVAFVIALVLAIALPGVLAFSAIRTLEGRGRQPRRGVVVAGLFALINGVGATGLMYLTESPLNVLWSGATHLVWSAPAEVSDTPETPETPDGTKPDGTKPDAAKPDGTKPDSAKPAPTGSTAMEGSRKAVTAVLIPSDAKAATAALTDESAAALGAVWMAFLTEQFGPELEAKADPAVWASVHDGLPDQPDLWGDPAVLEPVLVPRGRAFLGDVLTLADAMVAGEGLGPVTWAVLPDPVLAFALEHGANSPSDATFREVAMNRVEVAVGDTTWNVRYEDHGWRVHVGDFGELATRRISPTALLIALRP